MAVKIDIDAEAGWYAGADMDFNFTIYRNQDHTEVLDISARALLWQLRTDVLNDVLLDKITPTDIEVTDGTGGLCTVHVTAEDTADFKEGWYNFSIMTTDSPRTIVTEGTIYLNKAATP